MSDIKYDVAIIGGGIVGCAVLFELTSIPFKKCGAIVVAWTDHQNEKLPLLKQQAHAAGIFDVDLMTKSELYKKEPHIKHLYKGALNIPGEGVIDSNMLGIIFAHHARIQGAKILTNCKVTGVNDRTLLTTKGTVHFKVAINCAGLYGDQVDQLANINTFSIRPRKGQYCVFSKNASHFLNSMIFPVPTEKSKGVALFKSVYDNLIIGPTAEDVDCRTQQPCDPHVHFSLLKNAYWMIPELSKYAPIGQYVGLRPATEYKDYKIRTYPHLGWITVGGIRSTGVSGSLGISQYVSVKLGTDMGIEPERGSMKHLIAAPWRLDDKGSSVIFDQYQYEIMHPMVLYGQKHNDSKL